MPELPTPDVIFQIGYSLLPSPWQGKRLPAKYASRPSTLKRPRTRNHRPCCFGQLMRMICDTRLGMVQRSWLKNAKSPTFLGLGGFRKCSLMKSPRKSGQGAENPRKKADRVHSFGGTSRAGCMETSSQIANEWQPRNCGWSSVNYAKLSCRENQNSVAAESLAGPENRGRKTRMIY